VLVGSAASSVVGLIVVTGEGTGIGDMHERDDDDDEVILEVVVVVSMVVVVVEFHAAESD